ncbi:MAG: 23S rRNA (guanosine(2251)-2'-O)-methyltransferase RlmB, partial [Thermodesulfobacteriota bacterium]
MSEKEYIFGPHSVFSALDAGKRNIYQIYVNDEKKIPEGLKKKALKKNIKIKLTGKDELFKLARVKNHQGIAAQADPLPFEDINYLFSDKLSDKPFILLLDSIEDPVNLGSIARSALCLGADAIVVPKNRAAGPTPAASKVSAGALEYIPLILQTNIVKTIDLLKKNSYWIGGLDADGERDISDSGVMSPFGLVIGSEGSGIRPLVKKSCDFLFKISQTSPVTSLNAGAAA